MRRSSVLLAALLLALLWAGVAGAQSPGGYDCEVLVGADGAFDARCVPQATGTAISTPTGTPANTSTAVWALLAGRHTPGQIVDVWRRHRPHLVGRE